VSTHAIRLLAIDLRRAIPAARKALALGATELEELVRHARSEHEGIELVVVSTAERLELYSTDASQATAFRVVLRELIRRAGGQDELRSLPTIEASGASVAQHLLRLAAGIEGSSGLAILAELNLAVARSRRAGTLGSESSPLFASAVEAGWRAYCETSVGDPTRSNAEREVALLEAERIVEAALVAWKADRASAARARRPAMFDTYYRRSVRRSAA
jgi:glutamyl-tRNA reductase